MKKLFARVTVVAALAAVATPALPCEAMQKSTASAQEQQQKKAEKKVQKKTAEKKAPEQKSTVASAAK